ncbi:MAG: hypothetical protein WA688_09335, partial [Thermoplasmata archaeon]
MADSVPADSRSRVQELRVIRRHASARAERSVEGSDARQVWGAILGLASALTMIEATVAKLPTNELRRFGAALKAATPVELDRLAQLLRSWERAVRWRGRSSPRVRREPPTTGFG